MLLYTHNHGNSSKLLKQELGIKSLKKNSTYKGFDLIINWGNSKPVNEHNLFYINHPQGVRNAVNKLHTFNRLFSYGIMPPSRTVPEDFMEQNWNKTVCRSIVNGTNGEGITICKRGEELPIVPLYIKYIEKIAEYRVHFGMIDGEVKMLESFRKRLRNGVDDLYPDRSKFIRNLDNGWVMCYEDINDNPSLYDFTGKCAQLIGENLGLSFGAMDIIQEKGTRKFYLLEVNSAPGLEERTAKMYANYFKQFGE